MHDSYFRLYCANALSATGGCPAGQYYTGTTCASVPAGEQSTLQSLKHIINLRGQIVICM